MKLSSIDLTIAPKHIVIFGPPGSGKTKLALALAEVYNIHMLSLEAGHTVGKQLPIAWQERINVIRIPDTRAAPVAMSTMLRLVKMGKIHTCEAHGMNDCVVCVKNLGASWNDLDLATLTSNDIVLMDTSTQLTFSAMAHIGKGTDESWKPERDDWGKLKNYMETIFSFFQVAPFNFICVSHDELSEMEDGKSSKLVPSAGSSNFARNFAKYFDTVVFTEVKNGKHIFNTKTTYANNILTKDRFNFDFGKDNERGLLPLFQEQVSNLAIKK